MEADDRAKALLDRILNGPEAPPPTRRFRWLESLPEAIRESLLKVKATWKDGSVKMSANGLSKRIAAGLREQGLHPPSSMTSISDWLREG